MSIMTEPLTPSQLFKIGAENLRNFGSSDPSSLKDANITSFNALPDQITEIVKARETLPKSERVAQEIGTFVCGDCLEPVSEGESCGHIEIGRDGSRRRLG